MSSTVPSRRDSSDDSDREPQLSRAFLRSLCRLRPLHALSMPPSPTPSTCALYLCPLPALFVPSAAYALFSSARISLSEALFLLGTGTGRTFHIMGQQQRFGRAKCARTDTLNQFNCSYRRCKDSAFTTTLMPSAACALLLKE